MTKIFAFLFVFTAKVVHSFVIGPTAMYPSSVSTELHADIAPEVDYDAPIDRLVAVGNAVRRAPFSISLGDFGSIQFDYTLGLGDFGTLALPTFRNGGGVVNNMDFSFLDSLDDECYLGKDGAATECVDFDPMH